MLFQFSPENPQMVLLDGPLSPLLANTLLDDLDKELAGNLGGGRNVVNLLTVLDFITETDLT